MDICLEDLKGAIELDVQSTWKNYKIYKNGESFGIKRYPNEHIKNPKELFKSLAFSEIYFLKRIKNNINFPKFVKMLHDKDWIYIVTKWEDNVVVFKDLLQTDMNPELLLNLYNQIYLILSYLNNTEKITHGDTFPHNFLLKKIEQKGSIKYTHSGRNYYFKNNGYIPILWDFGISRDIKNPKKAYYRIDEMLKRETVDESTVDIYRITESLSGKYTLFKDNSWFYLYARQMYLDYLKGGIQNVLQDYTKILEDSVLTIEL